MNSLYIGVGLTIITALVAALVGPFFIDWGLFRTSFEAEAERIFGAKVTVLGSIDARLLPSPWLSLGDVVVGSVDRPAGKIGRFEARLELTPLLKGEFHISELRLDRPSLSVALKRNGTLALAGDPAPVAGTRRDLGDASLEMAEIVDGRIDFADERAGRSFALERINGIVSGSALAGPLKAEGGAVAMGQSVAFRLAMGRVTAERAVPVKLQVTPGGEPVVVTVDAALSLTGGPPRATGTAVVQRIDPEAKTDRGDPGPTPWRLESRFAVDPARLDLDPLTLAIGPDDRAYQLNGRGRIDLGLTPNFDLALTAKQIDLDRALAGRVGEAVDLDGVARRVLGTIAGLPVPDMPGRLALDVPGLVVGGGVLQDLRLIARPRPGGYSLEELTARLPGRSQVTASGRLSLAGAPAFDGRLYVASEQPNAFAAWLRRGGVQGRLDPVSVDAILKIDADSFRADQMLARIGAAQVRGHVQVSGIGSAPRVETGITADRLDLDQIRVLAGLFASPAGLAPAATRIDLDAGQLVLGGVTARGVSARLAVDGESVEVSRLSVQDAAGAALDMTGRIDRFAARPDGNLQATVKAATLDGLVRMLRSLFPDTPALDRFAAAAPHLAPLDARLTLTGQANGERGDLQLDVSGTAGPSRLAVAGKLAGSPAEWRAGRIDLNARLDGPDGGRLMRQLGIPALSLKGAAGQASVTLAGVPATGLDGTAELEALGSRLALSGRVIAGDDGRLGVDGRGRLVSADLGPVLTVLGQPTVTPLGRLPVDLGAGLSGTWPKLTLKAIDGRLGAGPLRGEATADLGATPVKLDGRLELGTIGLADLIDLGLGAGSLEALPDAGQAWPGQALPGPSVTGLAADLRISAEALAMADKRVVERPEFRLRLRPGEVAVESFSGGLAGGKAGGQMRMRGNAGGGVAVSGDIKIDGAAFGELVWRRDGRAVASGQMDLTATFETAGRSVASLVSGAAGGGAFGLRNGTLRSVNPAAFDAIVAAADNGLELKEDRIRTLFQSRLDAGELPFERVDAAFSIGGGIVRLRDVAVASGPVRTSGTASLDLGRWTLEADWTIKADAGRNAVTGADPQVGVLFRGPLNAPVRSLDVAPLNAFLTLRAFEREVSRVEVLQQDIMERERFAREAKRLREEKLRIEREAREAREAEQRRADEEKRRLDEERRAREAAEAARRLEEKRKADAAAAAAAAAAEAARRTEEERRRSSTQGGGSNAGGQTPGLAPLPPPIQIGPAPGTRPAPSINADRAPLDLFSPGPPPVPPMPIGRP